MSTGKLDQSLDEIMKDSKAPRARGRGGRRSNPRRAATVAKAKIAAPAGGVSKNTKATKATRTAAPAVTSLASGESKIIVSGLPEDVDELQIKDYFSKTIGQVKKAMLTYGPSGRSRGIATIIFNKPGSAAEAAQQLNGVKVDNRSMKIEVVLGAKNVPPPPAPKTLGDRIAQQPRSAAAKDKSKGKTTAAKPTATNGTTRGGRGGKARSGRVGRPKAKTAEELDAEMQDYFGGEAVNGTAATGVANGQASTQAAGGDTGMVDEIS